MTGSDYTILQRLWSFVRGDTPAAEFEQWAYNEEGLQDHLGDALYMQTISANLSDRDEAWSIREALADHVRSETPHNCMCVRLRDLDVVDMGYYAAPQPAFESDREWTHNDVFESLDEVKRRGPERWWLWAARCRVCRQGWLVGSEERQNDVFCMRRLSESEVAAIEQDDQWPDEFDDYESLLRVGRHAGRTVHFVDPEQDSSLGASISDLARQRPEIAVTEIAALLNLDAPLAAKLARVAVEQDGVMITFDTD